MSVGAKRKRVNIKQETLDDMEREAEAMLSQVPNRDERSKDRHNLDDDYDAFSRADD